MASILLVFASLSGNTEEIADIIQTKLASDAEVTRRHIDMDDIEAVELENYDGILFGTYTWGDGDLPYELEDFYDDMDHLNLQGVPAACFGSCDSSYPEYGAAVDIISEKLQEKGAELLEPNLKIELDPEGEEITRCEEFAEQFLSKWKIYLQNV